MIYGHNLDEQLQEIQSLARELKGVKSYKISSMANISPTTVEKYRNGFVRGEEFNKNKSYLGEARPKTTKRILSAMRRLHGIRKSKRIN